MLVTFAIATFSFIWYSSCGYGSTKSRGNALIISGWGDHTEFVQRRSDLRHQVAAGDLTTRAERRNSAYHEIKDRVRFMTGSAVCRSFAKTQYSPANFDEVQKIRCRLPIR